MTKDEALRMALEALEAWETGCGTTEYLSLVEKAVTDIKEVLAQPEQEPVQCWKCGDMDAEFQAKCDVPACGMKETKQKPVANYCKECLTYNGHQEGCSQYTTPPQPEQEPVAWMEGESVYWHTNPSLNDWIRANGTPLYTAPPQRTWVGLTGFEQKELMAMNARDAVFATEAKLREKNT